MLLHWVLFKNLLYFLPWAYVSTEIFAGSSALHLGHLAMEQGRVGWEELLVESHSNRIQKPPLQRDGGKPHISLGFPQRRLRSVCPSRFSGERLYGIRAEVSIPVVVLATLYQKWGRKPSIWKVFLRQNQQDMQEVGISPCSFHLHVQADAPAPTEFFCSREEGRD